MKLIRYEKVGLLHSLKIALGRINLIRLDVDVTKSIDFGLNINFGKPHLALVGISLPFITVFLCLFEVQQRNANEQGIRHATSI